MFYSKLGGKLNMNLGNIINILFEHMELNNLVDNSDVDNIIKQFPESIYYGEMYRCMNIVGDIQVTDLWQSWSSSKDSACMVCDNLRSGIQKGSKRVVLKQNSIGIDLIKLLRLIKQMNISEEQKKKVCRLLRSYRYEKEILARINYTYEIVE